MKKMIRVLVVDDCPSIRSIMQAVLEQDGHIQVETAANGLEALARMERGAVDLVTLDINMPVMDGLETITRIMAACPIPILVISDVADSTTAFKALSSGALEVISKAEIDLEHPETLLRKIFLLSKVKVIRHISGSRLDRERHDGNTENNSSFKVVVIASSTGGPKALAGILQRLPATFPCPILISQHIVPGFIDSLVGWHAGLSRLPVQVAVAGELPQPGQVYYAPPHFHMTLGGRGEIVLVTPGQKEFFCPSGDKLFASAAQVFGSRTLAVVLTGMGEDGTQGAAQIRARGGVVIAQNEVTSIVYGMPKAVVDAGHADYVLPLERIDRELVRLTRTGHTDTAAGGY
ncbi:MAG: chemotaxis-specific protein-glutamate methyltransferase CheB [Magnetococcales bacterium]|nr:chemotaxis-specific protein-glutamate methyltransferase CheB [Magnetococcales bacterium]